MAGAAGTTGSAGSGGTTGAYCTPAELGAGEAPADECGAFVSSSGGSDETGDGTKDAPYASLAKALAEGATRLYLCGESFDEAPILPSGTTLFGALACTESWTHQPSTRSVIVPSAATLDAAGTSVAVRLASGTSTTTLADISVVAPDANEPSESSIALLADTVPVRIERSDLIAGTPMDGQDGASLDPDSALDGVEGSPGNGPLPSGICGLDTNPGGAGGSHQCQGQDVRGGDGGDALGNPGIAGVEGLPTTVDSTGDGGSGATTAAACAAGQPGADGEAAAWAEGARGIGGLTATGYVAANAAVGARGTPGQGGGGGGASYCLSGNTTASGGGGGSGGCGGAPGGPGGSAGASIALLSFEASVSLSACVLTAADGANGGDGGVGQDGGYGGSEGAAGGAGSCAGGMGGAGGRGAAGGGGLGGHSLAIAFVAMAGGDVPAVDGASALSAGAAGTGGLGGTENAYVVGDDGLGCEALDFGSAGASCFAL